MDEAYIAFLHDEHEWVPGSAGAVQEAFKAGWKAAMKAVDNIIGEHGCELVDPTEVE